MSHNFGPHSPDLGPPVFRGWVPDIWALGKASAAYLLVPSRECGKIVYWDHIGIMFPYSLLKARMCSFHDLSRDPRDGLVRVYGLGVWVLGDRLLKHVWSVVLTGPPAFHRPEGSSTQILAL